MDPAPHALISIFFSVLLLGASLHKFSDRVRFQGIVSSYRLVPAPLLVTIVLGIPVLELGIGLAWLVGLQPKLVALATALLLTTYTLAIGINILRNNTEIDCGCGFSGTTDKSTSYQTLTLALPLRNILLIALALLSLLPTTHRLLGLVDYLSIALGSVVMLLLYAALNQLMANWQIINNWRSGRGEGPAHG